MRIATLRMRVLLAITVACAVTLLACTPQRVTTARRPLASATSVSAPTPPTAPPSTDSRRVRRPAAPPHPISTPRPVSVAAPPQPLDGLLEGVLPDSSAGYGLVLENLDDGARTAVNDQ